MKRLNWQNKLNESENKYHTLIKKNQKKLNDRQQTKILKEKYNNLWAFKLKPILKLIVKITKKNETGPV